MFLDFIYKHKKKIAVIGGIITIAIIVWSVVYTVVIFHVTSIEPGQKYVSYLTPQLIVSFNKDVSDQDLVVSSSLDSISTKVEGKTLTIDIFSDMEPDNTYTFTIGSIHSKAGDVIKNYTITLNVNNKDDTLSDEANRIILERMELNKSPVLSDPVFNYLPHGTLDYSIDAEISDADTDSEKVTIIITLMLSDLDERTGRDAAIEKYKNSAMEYLRSLEGVDLNKYEIKIEY